MRDGSDIRGSGQSTSIASDDVRFKPVFSYPPIIKSSTPNSSLFSAETSRKTFPAIPVVRACLVHRSGTLLDQQLTASHRYKDTSIRQLLLHLLDPLLPFLRYL